jgi:hypothetical protein
MRLVAASDNFHSTRLGELVGRPGAGEMSSVVSFPVIAIPAIHATNRAGKILQLA